MDISKTEQGANAASEPLQQLCSPIVELRQYTLHPGQRDVLIDLFERALIEPHEAAGITVIGQFRDLEDPNRFVWLRGFPDMETRQTALQAFYSGPVWQEHQEAATATQAAASKVRLLRPARPTSGFYLDHRNRLPFGAEEVSPGLVVATIWSLTTPPEADFLDLFASTLAPVLTKNGASIMASFVTEASNSALPVSESEQAFVWFSRFRDQAAYDEHLANLALSHEWQDNLWGPVARRFKAAPEVLRLSPTARSLVRG